eukprot:Phypoly_transcript_03272.p1 GENE.Phypoly_transcript_03272~~Phypoly_transcript_03272.p1  ORF type:complete len:706 (+),score=67.96 Phypoly_transcript_03272:358-2475(+)
MISEKDLLACYLPYLSVRGAKIGCLVCRFWRDEIYSKFKWDASVTQFLTHNLIIPEKLAILKESKFPHRFKFIRKIRIHVGYWVGVLHIYTALSFASDFIPDLEILHLDHGENVPPFIERMISNFKHLKKLHTYVPSNASIQSISTLRELRSLSICGPFPISKEETEIIFKNCTRLEAFVGEICVNPLEYPLGTHLRKFSCGYNETLLEVWRARPNMEYLDLVATRRAISVEEISPIFMNNEFVKFPRKLILRDSDILSALRDKKPHLLQSIKKLVINYPPKTMESLPLLLLPNLTKLCIYRVENGENLLSLLSNACPLLQKVQFEFYVVTEKNDQEITINLKWLKRLFLKFFGTITDMALVTPRLRYLKLYQLAQEQPKLPKLNYSLACTCPSLLKLECNPIVSNSLPFKGRHKMYLDLLEGLEDNTLQNINTTFSLHGENFMVSCLDGEIILLNFVEQWGKIDPLLSPFVNLREIDLHSSESLTSSLLLTISKMCPSLKYLKLSRNQEMTSLDLESSSLEQLEMRMLAKLQTVNLSCPNLYSIVSFCNGANEYYAFEENSFVENILMKICSTNMVPKLEYFEAGDESSRMFGDDPEAELPVPYVDLVVKHPKLFNLRLENCPWMVSASISCPNMEILGLQSCKILSKLSIDCPKLKDLALDKSPKLTHYKHADFPQVEDFKEAEEPNTSEDPDEPTREFLYSK